MKKNLFWVLVLSAFSGAVTAGLFLDHHVLYHDNARWFTQFRDNLHSLNRFGEIAWWFPHNQFGYPGYYHSILGIPPCANPIFVLFGLVSWLLGRVGIFISSYQSIYVFYFGFVTPFIFLLGFWLLCREIFHQKYAIAFAMVLAAFSPGIMLNLSDIGKLEPAAYGLCFAAAFLSFLKFPSAKSFWRMCLANLLVAISFNVDSLIWNLTSLPIFLILVLLLPGRRGWARFHTAYKTIPPWQWGIYLGLVGVCLVPSLLTFSQGKELIRTKMGSRFYSFDAIVAGNPVEMITASLPGMGMDWNGANYSLVPDNGIHNASYAYLGMVCIPLAAIGLIFGKSIFRRLVFLMSLFYFTAVNLSTYSPIFNWMFRFESPLRGMNHYSDLSFRAGGFLLLILAAAIGFQEVIRVDRYSPKEKVRFLPDRRDAARRLFLWIFLGLTAVSALVYLQLDLNWASNNRFGLMLTLSFFYSICIYQLRRAVSRRHRHLAAISLLVVVLADVSTFAFLHVRNFWEKHVSTDNVVRIDETPAENGLGLRSARNPLFYTNSVLAYRDIINLAQSGMPLQRLPKYSLFQSAHLVEALTAEARKVRTTPLEHLSLPLAPEAATDPAFKPFLTAIASEPASGQVEVLRETYNELEVSVQTAKDALLFVRDAYSPYWKADRGGIEIPVAKAWGGFKAVPVPAGRSVVHFRFRPPGIGLALMVSYLVLFGTLCVCWWSRVSGIIPQFQLLVAPHAG